MIDGLAGRPFSARTLPPMAPLKEINKEKIIKVSRERYSTPRKDIEEKITRWTGVLETPAVMPQGAVPVLYDARCSMCGKDTKVPFMPDGKRPVYCKSCRTKLARPASPEAQPPQRPQSFPSQSIQSPPLSSSPPSPPPSPLKPIQTPPPPPLSPLPPPPLSPPPVRPVTLDDAVKREPVSFFRRRREEPLRPKKEIDLGGLKKALEESLDKSRKAGSGENEEKNNENGVIKPGQTVKF